MALVGINTAIDAMKQKFTESFSAMGANGFTIHFKEWHMGFDGGSGGKGLEERGAEGKRSPMRANRSPWRRRSCSRNGSSTRPG